MELTRAAACVLLASWAVAGAACQVRDCKAGTVLVKVAFAGAARDADHVFFEMSIDGAPVQTGEVEHAAGSAAGSVEIGFARGYQAGPTLSLTLTARKSGAAVASRVVTQKLSATCTAISLSLGSDGPSKQQGEACDPNRDSCAGGLPCVDGYCCESACTGQCQACDLDTHHGSCVAASGAPRGGRGACSGAGSACGGSCDGSKMDACVYPTLSCGTATCSAGMLSGALCSDGSCKQSTRACGAGECQDATACATVAQVSAGGGYSCALLSTGNVYCWGGNGNEQLGRGSGNTEASDKPLKVTLASGALASQITTSFEGNSCALIVDKAVQCWGYDNAGQLGRNSSDNVNGKADYVQAGQATSARLSDVVRIGRGAEHNCAIRGGGGGVCWGLNLEGEGGTGASTMPPGPQPYPDAVCPVGSAPGVCATKATNLAWVSGGNYMSCWVTTDGGLACSGLAMNGSMGPGGIDRKNPTAIALPAGIVAASVTTSGSSSCVLSTTGVPVCFGANGSGQLGRTAANAQPNLSTICDDAACTARLEGVAQLELGGDFGCARLTGSGAVRCWGGNGRGQLGDGSTADKAYAEPPILMDARWISAGSGHACAVTGPEEIRCWGDNTFGQLGDGDATHTAKPTPVLVRF